MDLHKLKASELKTWEPAKLKETEDEVRKALADIRMDIYTARSQHHGKVRGLKRTLARVKTVTGDRAREAARTATKGEAK